MNKLNYYEQVEQTHPIGKLFFKWNWAAFFCGGYWLAYRKCYVPALIVILISIFLKPSLYGFSPDVFYGVAHKEYFLLALILVLKTLLGAFGTSIYFKEWSKTKVYHNAQTIMKPLLLFGILEWVLMIIVFALIAGRKSLGTYELVSMFSFQL